MMMNMLVMVVWNVLQRLTELMNVGHFSEEISSYTFNIRTEKKRLKALYKINSSRHEARVGK